MPIIEVDASGLEWRSAMFLSQDKVGIEEIKNGVDTHDDNRKIYKLGEGQAARTVAKKFLFKLIYGARAYSYSVDPEFTHVSNKESFWQRIIDTTYDKYSGLAVWHKSIIKEARETRKVVIPTGRVFEFENPWDDRATPDILNYPCQGLGSDIV